MFEVEYLFGGLRNAVVVKPIMIKTVVIFLVHFPGGETDPMALVYNKKDIWADIEKESTGLTEAVGQAIEDYYSDCYLPCGDYGDVASAPPGDNHLLN
jgi:hypothetical protein